MKNLKKMLIVVVAIVTVSQSYAQIFGVKAGLNLSNMLDKDDVETYSKDFKMKPGFHVGATAEFPINEMFSFETGLLLSTKGYKYSQKETDFESKETLNLLYVDIPLTAKAYYVVGGTKIYGAVGPYIGMGLSGKAKTVETGMGEKASNSETVKWGSNADNDIFKRLDFGLTVGAGVEINSIQFGFSYGLGLANISPSTDGGAKISNRVFAISVGYKFAKK
jgi:opacity protein-like surface antigen